MSSEPQDFSEDAIAALKKLEPEAFTASITLLSDSQLTSLAGIFKEEANAHNNHLSSLLDTDDSKSVSKPVRAAADVIIRATEELNVKNCLISRRIAILNNFGP